MKVLIVEDDQLQAEELAKQTKKILGSNTEIVGPFSFFKEAITELERTKPDLALLDIQLQEDRYAGVHLGETLGLIHSIPTLFVTGITDEKVLEQTREIPQCNFLKKPFDESSLKRALGLTVSSENVDEENDSGKVSVKAGLRDKYWIKESKLKYTGVAVDKILYVEAMDHHCRFHIDAKKPIVMKSTIKEGVYNNSLSVYENFMLLGRGVIMNLNRIEKIEGNQVVFDDDKATKVTIPKNSRVSLFKKLGLPSNSKGS